MRSQPASGFTADRLAYVDGLRAVAVLGTVAFHVFQFHLDMGGAGPLGEIVRAVLKMGAHGVDLFFVLSGFCLAHPTLERMRGHAGFRFDLTSFWAKRLVRIVPPYYAAIAVTALLLGLTGRADPGSLDAGQIGKQIAFLDSDVIFLNGSFWTLPIELRWYAIFPLALWLYARSPRSLGALALGTVVVGHFTRMGGVDFGTLPLFLAGLWAGDLYVRGVRAAGYATAFFVPTALLATLLEPPMGKQFYAIEPIGMVATIAFVVAAGSIGPLRAALAWRPLAFTGIASYSIYLLNDPVVRVATGFGAGPLLCALAALAVSFAFYAAIERPIVRGALRDRMVAAIGAVLARAVAWLRLPSVIRVEAAAVALPEPLRTRRAEAAATDLRSSAP